MVDAPWTGDACSLVDAFRAGERSPVEELEATAAAIERSDLNAFAFLDLERRSQRRGGLLVESGLLGGQSGDRHLELRDEARTLVDAETKRAVRNAVAARIERIGILNFFRRQNHRRDAGCCRKRPGGALKALTFVAPGRYRHYKGNEYTVLGVARHSETEEELVVYRQEYGERGLWVRPKAMFEEHVVINGTTVPRFEFVD